MVLVTHNMKHILGARWVPSCTTLTTAATFEQQAAWECMDSPGIFVGSAEEYDAFFKEHVLRIPNGFKKKYKGWARFPTIGAVPSMNLYLFQNGRVNLTRYGS